MFLLLPDEAFDGEYPRAIRERMVQEEHVKFEGTWENDYRWIDVSHMEKGELRIEDDGNLPLGYVYFWRLPDSRHLVSVLDNKNGKLKAYCHTNGKLEKDEDFYAFVNENSDITVHDLFDLKNISQEVEGEPQFFTGYDLSVSEDSTITFIIKNEHYYDYPGREIFDALEHYLEFERKGDKWTKTRIKTYGE